YNAQILPTVNVTPSLQYIVHPGAINSVGNATVLAVRVSLAF
ncbi:MAG: carbohydrate porin, partial [Planctomycetes bacterium]|nr:carbohydrate porin [Planctomycetota bacterium]